MHNMDITSYVLGYGTAFFVVVFVATYRFVTRNFNHWKKKGVKHVPPLPFVGNLKDVVLLKTNIGLVAKEVYNEFKNEPCSGLYAFDEPVLLVHEPAKVKAVLVQDFSCFTDRSMQVDWKKDSLLARSLFALRGDRWKHARNKIAPTFSSAKMKGMFELITECAIFMTTTIETEKWTGKPVQIYELVARYTTDIIASCAFGIQGNALADPKADFRRILRRSIEFTPWQSIVMAAAFLAPKIVELFRIKSVPQEVEDFIRNTIKSTIKEREIHQIKRNDLLNSLIEMKSSDKFSVEDESSTLRSSSKIMFDEEDICSNSFLFLNAGFETSSITISYALYELAKNEELQDKLRREIKEASVDGCHTYDAIQEMKYLDMVLKETLRKYPPLPFLDRVTNKPYTFPNTDLKLENGSRVLIPIYALHMDPEYHPNPMKFDPERFSAENKENIINFTYLPFGDGPRYCIGIRLGHIQTKTALVHLLMKYSVHTCSNTPDEVEFNPHHFLLQPKEKIQLVLKTIT